MHSPEALEGLSWDCPLPYRTSRAVDRPTRRTVDNHKCYLYLDLLRAAVPSVCGLLFRPSRFRGLPQDVAVPSRFRRRESFETNQM